MSIKFIRKNGYLTATLQLTCVYGGVISFFSKKYIEIIKLSLFLVHMQNFLCFHIIGDQNH